MAVDLKSLAELYDIIHLNVISSTRVSGRTAAIIAKLGRGSSSEKPCILILKAKARVAVKLVSIVEIAKRDLAANNIDCFQYNALNSEMIEIDRTLKQATNGGLDEIGPKPDDESDDAFENLNSHRGSDAKKKKRLVPVMTIYLSAVSVKELKNAYGEQRCGMLTRA